MNNAHFIDHTMLKPEATEEMIVRYCEEAVKYGFASVCVNTYRVPLAAKLLKDSGVKVCCTIGFPLGAMSPAAKAFETAWAIQDGADEIDMVINIGAVKDGAWDVVQSDIREVVRAANGHTVKVIIETCLLTDEEKVKACEAAEKAGAQFVKTSTGFSTGGATLEDVRLMKKTVGDRLKVKASGGIRTPEFMEELIEAGAERIGAGNGVILLK